MLFLKKKLIDFVNFEKKKHKSQAFHGLTTDTSSHFAPTCKDSEGKIVFVVILVSL